VASLLLSRTTVPVLYFLMKRREMARTQSPQVIASADGGVPR